VNQRPKKKLAPNPYTQVRARNKSHDRAPERPTAREIKYYGTAACLEIWKRRPADVIRIYITEERVKQFGPMLKWAAANRKAYHVVEDLDLEKLTEATHHQGVCVLAHEKESVSVVQLKNALKNTKGPVSIAYLDGVENPHNLGAIVRTCAHFGVRYVVGERGRLPAMSPSACRVAEGGAEHVDLVAVSNRDKDLQQLRDLGFAIVATAATGDSLYRHRFAERTLVVMGAEGSGVSRSLSQNADVVLAIPGSGDVESLNVSVAFGVVLSECRRQQMELSSTGKRR